MADLDSYLARITDAHRDKPKFMAMLALCLQPYVDAQDLIASFVAAYDLDEAIGAQLDVVGKWVGRSRVIEAPVRDPWFRFGDSSRGLGRGVWKDRYSPGSTLTKLDDVAYRKLLRAKIAANNGLESSFLPGYAIDAAPDATGSSSMPTKAITALLKDFGVSASPYAFNQRLADLGYIKQLSRLNSKRDTVYFWSVTDKGMEFGKNITSPNSPRQTQPHWYVERFAELAEKVRS